jgi:hypothetical protein
MIRNRAKIAKVWQYMNPATKAGDLPMLSRPTLPLLIDINSMKTSINELTPLETEELKVLRDERKDQNREYEKQQSAIENLHTLIHETVSRSYYTYLIKKDTLHDMLAALKQRVGPSDQARELEVKKKLKASVEGHIRHERTSVIGGSSVLGGRQEERS